MCSSELGLPKHNLSRVITGLFFVLITQISFGAPPVISSAVKSSIRSRVNYQYTPGMIVGMVNADGRAIYSFGQTTYGSNKTPDEHTVYEIGSISKILTTSLLADMLNNGEVELDDLVEDYLPEEVNMPSRNGRKITLEHLATHFSGLPTNPETIFENDSTNPFVPFDTSHLYDYLNNHTLVRRPGQSFEYSNLGMGLLGHVLALAKNQSFESLLKERLFEPLGMDESVITWDESKNHLRATGYSGVVERPFFRMEVLESAGAVLSTVDDLLTFAEYHMDLRDSPLNQSFKESHKKLVNTESPGVDLGLGWFILSNTPSPILFHDGATLGHNSFFGMDVANQTAVVVLTNARVNAYSGVQDIGIHLLFPPSPLASIRRVIDVPVDRLQSIYGDYESESGNGIDVGLEANHMTIAFSADPTTRYTLYPITTSRFMFYEATIEASATFRHDSENRPFELTWRQSGNTESYQKVLRPAQLSLTALSDSMQLELLDGDGAAIYDIQSTQDFKNWTPLDRISLWDEPLNLNREEPNLYFRAIALDSGHP